MKKHFVSYQKIGFLLLVFTILSRGVMFLNESIGIDTEVVIALKDVFYDSWLGIGRFGLVFLKAITDTFTFNPYLTGIGVLLLLPLACMLWVWLFDTIIGNTNKMGALFFSLMMIASTIMTEQLYFKLQAMEICMGLCLMPISLLVIYKMIVQKMKWKMKVFSVAIVICINIILFSLYQVMVPLFITGVVMSMYLYIFFGQGKEETTKQLWKTVGVYASIFLASFILNQMIVKLFFEKGDDYLGGQIFWGIDDFSICLQNIFEHVKEIAFGTQIYYAKTFSVYVVIMLGITVYMIIQEKEKKTGKNILGILCLIGLFLAPFYMTLLCGKAPVVRSQLVYPFVLSFMGYTVFCLVDTKVAYKYFIIFIGLFTVFLQVKYSTMLQYSDLVRYKSDVRIATELMREIDELQSEEMNQPVIFYGSHPAELNASCIKGEVIGYSFFEWDTEVEPKGFFSSRRILSFMHTLGRTYQQPSEEQVKSAHKYVQDMSCWPGKGSIVTKDNMIIVKLSNLE